MPGISEDMLYEGVSFDILFASPQPGFGDLIQICGYDNPSFPPSGSFAFDELAHLQFSQVDDYFGIRSLAEEGDDVAVWLFPLVAGLPVHHHPGPFDGIRLTFNVLRNPSRYAEHFLKCVACFSAFGTDPLPDIEKTRSDVKAITEHWRAKGIEVGSDSALDIDY